VNFFKLVVAALRARPARSKIITDDLNFPSDVYILQGAVDLLGNRHRLHIIHSDDGLTIPTDQVRAAIDDDTVLVSLTHTAFKSGYVYDMAAITEAAHRVGALPLEMNKCEVDLAVGCTYKYLNGGPGAAAFLFVRKDWQDELHNPIWGWFGQQRQFDFGLRYQPASGITRWQAGTPGILALSAVEPAVDLLLEAGIDRLRAKSIAQTEYLIKLWEELLQPLGVTMNSPRDHRQRGSHVSIGHAEALRIDRALIEDLKVIPDFRTPDNIRLSIAPLYTSFVDIHEGVMRLRRAIVERLYEKYPAGRPDVT
jgi:kynureninase